MLTAPVSGVGEDLAGATLLITRPSGTARGFVSRARARGARPLSLPGLALRAGDAPGTLRALRNARGADVWIFTSPAAVRFAFGAAPAW
ncbi:uroporphyrinogen-III synthase, partial [Dokdonella sp.]|uniref:uroporphyrinogen-III synthase n=1 Tax=Dokdonella sp. TaxID=2291710 RepID=UPI002F4DFC6E